MILLEKQHKWKDMTLFTSSSPYLPSNFGISNGNLVDMADHVGSWVMGSFALFDRSSRCN